MLSPTLRTACLHLSSRLCRDGLSCLENRGGNGPFRGHRTTHPSHPTALPAHFPGHRARKPVHPARLLDGPVRSPKDPSGLPGDPAGEPAHGARVPDGGEGERDRLSCEPVGGRFTISTNTAFSHHHIHQFPRHDDDLPDRLSLHEPLHVFIGERRLLDLLPGRIGGHGDMTAELAFCLRHRGCVSPRRLPPTLSYAA